MKRILYLSLLAFVATTIIQAKDVAVFVNARLKDLPVTTTGGRTSYKLPKFVNAAKVSPSETTEKKNPRIEKIGTVNAFMTKVDLANAVGTNKDYSIEKTADGYEVLLSEDYLLTGKGGQGFDPNKKGKNYFGFNDYESAVKEGNMWRFTLKEGAGFTTEE